MTYQRRYRHSGNVVAGAASLTTLAVVAAFLASSAPGASAAAVTSTSTSTSTSTTTTTVPAPNCSGPISGNALGRSGWVASTNAPSSSADAAANALDGKLTTRFSTNEHQAPGLYFEVDLGSAHAFDELAMVAPHSPSDYARGYDVDVSANGTSWTTVKDCTGTGAPEIVSFPTQTARYIKVVLTTATTTAWWSIDEFYLYTSGPVPTSTTTTTVATSTTSLSSSANPVPVGVAVTYTAKVVPAPGGGTVNFFGDGLAVLGCHKVAVSTTTGDATCSTTYVAGGRI